VVVVDVAAEAEETTMLGTAVGWTKAGADVVCGADVAADAEAAVLMCEICWEREGAGAEARGAMRSRARGTRVWFVLTLYMAMRRRRRSVSACCL